MPVHTELCSLLGIKHPIIMAPMFLVSNEAMTKAAVAAGIMGVFPTLNFRDKGRLEEVLQNLYAFRERHGVSGGSYGVNLIVQKSNPLYEKHLKVCVDQKVPFYITSLGNPKEVIQAAHAYGAKVFCDVVNIAHAEKCHAMNCDGFIAVGQGAGGHAGPNPLQLLIPSLRQRFPDTPVVAAGGIATGAGILSVLALGAAGVSVGTRFIASEEAGVSEDYKNAIVDAGMDDIVLTEKLSGTPCTVINTPYARKVGYKQNWLEKALSKNPKTKKYFKMLVQFRGMKRLERAVKPGTYQTLWCAGQSVEMIHDIRPVQDIVNTFIEELDLAMSKLSRVFGEL